jgi:hypothetical protein
MRTNENISPCANAGNWADFKAERKKKKASARADAAAFWLAECFSMPAALARILTALASLGRAFA